MKLNHKRLRHAVCIGTSVILTVLLAFLPFENLFLTFNSPVAAYEYYILGESDVNLIIEGKECDFVVDSQNDVDRYLIVPKTTEGWKIGIGINTRKIVQKISNGICVYIYQYKNTDEYFITVFNTNGGEMNLTDNYNTKFYSLERNNDFLQESFVTYYAYIPDYNSQYSITVDDVIIAIN